MGKILGAFLGLLLFSIPGGILGFILGAAFDLFVKPSNFNFFSNSFNFADNSMINGFPLLAAYVIGTPVDKESVLIIKNISIETFGLNTTKDMMQRFKNFVENGYTENQINAVCEEINYRYDLGSKLNLINTLTNILRTRGFTDMERVNNLKKIAALFGLAFADQHSSQNYNYNYSNSYSNNKQLIDPYEVMGVEETASDDEIKKQYRKLCKQYHPDKYDSSSETDKKNYETKLKKIIEAYDDIKKERGIK